jgi:hypothetical protein
VDVNAALAGAATAATVAMAAMAATVVMVAKVAAPLKAKPLPRRLRQREQVLASSVRP